MTKKYTKRQREAAAKRLLKAVDAVNASIHELFDMGCDGSVMLSNFATSIRALHMEEPLDVIELVYKPPVVTEHLGVIEEVTYES